MPRRILSLIASSLLVACQAHPAATPEESPSPKFVASPSPAASPSPSPSPSASRPSSAPAAGTYDSLRDVPWKDREYVFPAFLSEMGSESSAPAEHVVIRGGTSGPREMGSETYWIDSVTYGDVTNDGAEEALVVASYNGGGTLYFSQVLIFSLSDKRPVMIGHTGAEPNVINAASIDKGTIRLTRLAGSPAGYTTYVQSWVWQGGKVVLVKQEKK